GLLVLGRGRGPVHPPATRSGLEVGDLEARTGAAMPPARGGGERGEDHHVSVAEPARRKRFERAAARSLRWVVHPGPALGGPFRRRDASWGLAYPAVVSCSCTARGAPAPRGYGGPRGSPAAGGSGSLAPACCSRSSASCGWRGWRGHAGGSVSDSAACC